MLNRSVCLFVCCLQNLKESFLKSIQNRLSSGILKFGTQSLHFTSDDSVPVEENVLPVLIEESETVLRNFSKGEYYGNLQSKVLGNTVIYVDVIPSTMTLFDGYVKIKLKTNLDMK